MIHGLRDVRVVDFTHQIAGPYCTKLLSDAGADVIHVESARRPDGMRMVGGMLRHKHEAWWECSHFFVAANANKRGLALDLGHPRGLELMKHLIARADALVDNFTPRVLDGFGLTWETLHDLNPRAIMLRMPAFGLTGPWRDHTGFAQTMEQLTGLAWLTGHPDDQPRIQRGPCDPLAGMHAASAFLVALAEREAKGEGVHVECSMVEGALNAASEALIEFSAYGARLERQGNRSPAAAPQGLYPALGHAPETPRWLALSVASDAQWRALCGLMGRNDWARDPQLASLAGRRAAHDRLDDGLRAWVGSRERGDRVEELSAAGIPAAALRDPRAASRHPQMVARGYFEPMQHPVVGRHTVPGLPFRYGDIERWVRHAAPTLGQHNREILSELGVDDAELEALERDGVIGSRPVGE